MGSSETIYFQSKLDRISTLTRNLIPDSSIPLQLQAFPPFTSSFQHRHLHTHNKNTVISALAFTLQFFKHKVGEVCLKDGRGVEYHETLSQELLAHVSHRIERCYVSLWWKNWVYQKQLRGKTLLTEIHPRVSESPLFSFTLSLLWFCSNTPYNLINLLCTAHNKGKYLCASLSALLPLYRKVEAIPCFCP